MRSYMRSYMRMKSRADKLGITVRELRERPDFFAILKVPTRRLFRGGVVVERWSWLGGCYHREVRRG